MFHHLLLRQFHHLCLLVLPLVFHRWYLPLRQVLVLLAYLPVSHQLVHQMYHLLHHHLHRQIIQQASQPPRPLQLQVPCLARFRLHYHLLNHRRCLPRCQVVCLRCFRPRSPLRCLHLCLLQCRHGLRRLSPVLLLPVHHRLHHREYRLWYQVQCLAQFLHPSHLKYPRLYRRPLHHRFHPRYQRLPRLHYHLLNHRRCLPRCQVVCLRCFRPRSPLRCLHLCLLQCRHGLRRLSPVLLLPVHHRLHHREYRLWYQVQCLAQFLHPSRRVNRLLSHHLNQQCVLPVNQQWSLP